MHSLEPKLRQRGRASVDFMVHIVRGSEDVRQRAQTDIEQAAGDPDTLPDDLDARTEKINAGLKSKASRVKSSLGEWHGRSHGPVATEAFEEIQTDLQPDLDAAMSGPAQLYLDPDFVPPAYWADVEFHRTAGGWDGHPYAGYVHGEIIHKRMVNSLFPGGIFKQRRLVAERAPRKNYNAILDMGISTGHFATALAETYPDAKLTGVDLSSRALEHSYRTANVMGWDWKLYQRPAEETGFATESFDLVTSYIVLHEVPERIIRKIFDEAYRVLKPGGDLLMSDVTRYSDMNKLQAWQADQGAAFGGEPHWRESASADLGAIACEVGFANVVAEGLAPMSYPHVVTGTKP